MIHIVFQQADVDLLKSAMQLDKDLEGEILEIKDEWGVGPLKDLDTDQGWMSRLEWWKELLLGSPYGQETAGSFDDRETVRSLIEKMEDDEEQECWLWVGQNQHDVTGYFWLMRQLKHLQGRIKIIFLNNLPFINEKGQLFYPWCISDIMPKEAVKAKKLARTITVSEFEVDPDEWKRISDENSTVRILEGGKKIVSKDESFYDSEVLKNIGGEWQKASRVVTNTMNRMKIKTGDVYLMWRLKQMIGKGRVEVLGDMNKGWKEFDVRLHGKSVDAADESEESIIQQTHGE